MAADEAKLRGALVRWASRLFERRFTVGSSGNISVRFAVVSCAHPPIRVCGFLDADRLAMLDASGRLSAVTLRPRSCPCTWPSMRGVLRPRPWCVSIRLMRRHFSCLADVDPEDAIAPITPYVVMRVGRVPVLPYTKPGSADIAPTIRAPGRAPCRCPPRQSRAVIPAVARERRVAVEESEETAAAILLAEGMSVRHLEAAAIAECRILLQAGSACRVSPPISASCGQVCHCSAHRSCGARGLQGYRTALAL